MGKQRNINLFSKLTLVKIQAVLSVSSLAKTRQRNKMKCNFFNCLFTVKIFSIFAPPPPLLAEEAHITKILIDLDFISYQSLF